VTPSTSAARNQRAERIALGASCVFLFVLPFAASGGVRATCLIVATIAIAASGLLRASLRDLPRSMLIPWLAWVALSVLSLAWSIDRAQTWQELRGETFYGALAFVLFFSLASDATRWRQWWLAIMAGTVLALVATALQNASLMSLWRHSPDGGVGAYSTHLVLVAPLLVALATAPPWGLSRRAILLVTALTLLIVAAWSTRGAWSTPNRIVWPALAAVFIVALVAARKSRALALGGEVSLQRVLALAGIAIAIAFLASVAAKNERFYRHDPSPIASVERDLRPRLWAVAAEEWRKAPLLGHGLGREILASAFLPHTPANAEHPPVTHGHNTLLNVALQLGAVGVFAFVTLLGVFAWRYARLLGAPATAALGVIGLALIAGFLVKNTTDDFFHRHNAHLFWALNGMLLGFGERARDR
jgi:O-antigen ligase